MLSNQKLSELFKFKLLFSKFDALPVAKDIEAQLIKRTKNSDFFSVFATKNSDFFSVDKNFLSKNLYFLLAKYKETYFKSFYNLSKYTSVRQRFVDYREKPPKFTEFDFNLDSAPAYFSSTHKTKIPISVYISRPFFLSKIYAKFSKFYSFRRLEPYERTTSILFRKILLKLNSFLTYQTLFFGIFTNFTFELFRSLNLLLFQRPEFFNVLTKILYSNVAIFSHSSFFGTPSDFTGLIKLNRHYNFMLKYSKDLNKLKMRFPDVKNKFSIVKHFGYYYPFFARETLTPNINSSLFFKNLKKASFFTINTTKMLKRIFKSHSMFKPRSEFKNATNFLSVPLNDLGPIIRSKFFLTNVQFSKYFVRT